MLFHANLLMNLKGTLTIIMNSLVGFLMMLVLKTSVYENNKKFKIPHNTILETLITFCK